MSLDKGNRLKDVARQEFIVMDRIIKDDLIVKALLNNGREFMNTEIPDKNNRDFMAFNYVYPHDFIPYNNNTDIQNAKTYITISFTDYRPGGSTKFKANTIQINVWTHQDLERIDEVFMTRTKFIASRIDELFNDTRGLGIGVVNFYGMNVVRINETYQGYSILYKIWDQN